MSQTNALFNNNQGLFENLQATQTTHANIFGTTTVAPFYLDERSISIIERESQHALMLLDLNPVLENRIKSGMAGLEVDICHTARGIQTGPLPFDSIRVDCRFNCNSSEIGNRLRSSKTAPLHPVEEESLLESTIHGGIYLKHESFIMIWEVKPSDADNKSFVSTHIYFVAQFYDGKPSTEKLCEYVKAERDGRSTQGVTEFMNANSTETPHLRVKRFPVILPNSDNKLPIFLRPERELAHPFLSFSKTKVKVNNHHTYELIICDELINTSILGSWIGSFMFHE